MLLLTLRGTPFLYYGDEIGLPDVPVTGAAVRDHAGGRDGGRTPMPWAPGAWTEPWLPIGEGPTVAEQRDDPDSTLHLVRDLIALRPAFATAGYAGLPAPAGAWAYRRADHAVALNLGSSPAVIEGIDGTIAIATDRARDGERFDGRLGPAEAAVVRVSHR